MAIRGIRMKLQLNLDTDNKADVQRALRLMVTACNFDKKAKPSDDAAMANKIIDIMEGK